MTTLEPEAHLPIRLLLSAYACHPAKGSEPGVGWEFLRAALRVSAEVHLLTRENNVAALEAALTPEEHARCRIVGFDLGAGPQRWKKRVYGGTQAYYLAWQTAARQRVRQLHAEHAYDLAHHVTFAVDWAPAAVSEVEDLPFVWGPVGGATSTPLHLASYLGPKGAATDTLRLVSGGLGRRWIGEHIARVAALTVANNDDVAHRFRPVARQLAVEPNTSISASFSRENDPWNRDGPVVGVGRLVPWKGWALALDAMARTTDNSLRFVLFGDGPDRRRLMTRAQRLDIADRVTLAGSVPRTQVIETLRTARALLFPSFHDSAGWAVAEALASGCPAVCLSLGGPPELVARAGGTVVSHDEPGVAGGLAAALAAPTPPHNPDSWSADRLPAILARWYQQALVSPEPSSASRPVK